MKAEYERWNAFIKTSNINPKTDAGGRPQRRKHGDDMNTLTGAEAMVRMLQHNGVQHIFGLCGDTSLPFYDALYRLDHGMRHILTRDERSAGMADAYARDRAARGRRGPQRRRRDLSAARPGGGQRVVGARAGHVTSDVAVGSRGKYPLTELDQDCTVR